VTGDRNRGDLRVDCQTDEEILAGCSTLRPTSSPADVDHSHRGHGENLSGLLLLQQHSNTETIAILGGGVV